MGPALPRRDTAAEASGEPGYAPPPMNGPSTPPGTTSGRPPGDSPGAPPGIPPGIAWNVVGVEHGEAPALLSGGLALLEALAEHPVPTLRWYRARQPALVLGRGQGDIEVRARDGLSVVTRHSGGGAVLLDPDVLSLDVLLPAGHHWLSDADLGHVFVRVGRVWAEALEWLGVPDVTLYDGPATARRRGSPRERLLAAVCYATLGRGEVLSGGRKIVGLSQRRRRQGALVQCGLLQRWSPAPLLSALGADPRDPEILQAAVGLHDVLAAGVSEDRVRSVVEEAFVRAAQAA